MEINYRQHRGDLVKSNLPYLREAKKVGAGLQPDVWIDGRKQRFWLSLGEGCTAPIQIRKNLHSTRSLVDLSVDCGVIEAGSSKPLRK